LLADQTSPRRGKPGTSPAEAGGRARFLRV
jgi:hypothetical protein